MQHRFFILIVMMSALVLVSLAMWWERKETPRNMAFVRIRNTTIPVEVRTDAASRAKGLSWRAWLPRDQGMLFLFPKPDRATFWMQGMQFPLDFIWIAGDRVVDLTENVQPPPPLQTLSPSVPADRVLEVNARFIAEHAIQNGDPVEMVFDKNIKIE
ncbi:DUF192 domain-containing protein [Candidatus Uhrbacteria bacterium]|nr:DUF192 domain-containing protein [Candidatus Uhrbacteria bacterium]